MSAIDKIQHRSDIKLKRLKSDAEEFCFELRRPYVERTSIDKLPIDPIFPIIQTHVSMFAIDKVQHRLAIPFGRITKWCSPFGPLLNAHP